MSIVRRFYQNRCERLIYPVYFLFKQDRNNTVGKDLHLIIGFGYLGKFLLNRLEPESCWVTNRIENTSLPRQLAMDVNQPDTWSSLDVLQDGFGWNIYFMVPPSRIDLDLFSPFVDQLGQSLPDKTVLVSSTVVYGQKEREVNADSDVLLDSNRARRQYQIESIWLSRLSSGHVVRFAGLYGPGRIVGQRQLQQAQLLSGNPDGWLNLIHINDAAALLCCIDHQAGSVELGSDGTPLRRRDYYTKLAKLMKVASPSFQEAVDAAPGRRCDNTLTRQRCDWKPKHDDVYLSIKQFLDEQT